MKSLETIAKVEREKEYDNYFGALEQEYNAARDGLQDFIEAIDKPGFWTADEILEKLRKHMP